MRFPADKIKNALSAELGWDALALQERALPSAQICCRLVRTLRKLEEGGIPNLADAVTRESYSHECISMGWWLGGGSTPILEPSFYAYAYPEPPGCPDAVIAPVSASYDLRMHEWILPYEAVRRAPDPEATLLEFAQSTYEAAADLGGWERALLER